MAEQTDYTYDQQANGEGGFEQFEQQQQNAEPMEGQETDYNASAGGGGEGMKVDDDDERKIFVGNLSWETSQKDLKDYFCKFGEVENCVLKQDLETRRSRGFGFVVFKDVGTVDKVLEEKTHSLGGRNIDPKRANPRKKEEAIKKIFVGKVDPSLTEAEIKEYFETFGEVKKIDLPYDKAKEQRRAFCFVEFKEEDAVKKITDQSLHKIKDQEVDVKKALPNSQNKRGRGGWGYGYGGGRGGWQGYNQGGYGYGGYGQGGYGYGGYGYGGYDYYGGGPNYGNWGGYDQNYYNYGNYGGDGQQQSNYGKTQKGGRGGGGGYHPYNR
ncbi:heterogeneous nuclear ribonucleoprotein D-like-B isoform X2 [Ostrea edulis]|uniref:heterogeneous nuclear ribonucleoprotein D-like-B isoform X2 n=1 Tax=Ostrea edulis TaxID=37623 RepID=UPI0020946306|nr:heterogeneous nuclear ribonucleoprotein D-like-B isoform X2 [Ostrea edulis]